MTTELDQAKKELDDAIDDVCEWLDYEGYSIHDVQESIKRLNSARMRVMVLERRQNRQANATDQSKQLHHTIIAESKITGKCSDTCTLPNIHCAYPDCER
jgi:hypothetical protein